MLLRADLGQTPPLLNLCQAMLRFKRAQYAPNHLHQSHRLVLRLFWRCLTELQEGQQIRRQRAAAALPARLVAMQTALSFETD